MTWREEESRDKGLEVRGSVGEGVVECTSI